MIRSLLLRLTYPGLDFRRVAAGNRSDGICLVDLHGRLTFTNHTAERLLGWTDAELRGQALYTAIHRCSSDDRDPSGPCPLREAAAGRTLFHRDDTLLRRRDGSIIPVSFLSSPLVVDGRIAGTVLSFHNMSSHERELADLRESEERYRCLAEATPEAMWLTDRYGYVTMANTRAAQLFGYSTWGQMLQTHFLELFDLDDRPRAAQSKRAVLRESRSTEGEFLLVRQDGTEITARVSVSPAQQTEEGPAAFLYVAEDLTQQKRLEAEQSRANEIAIDLEVLVAEVLARSSSAEDAIPSVLQAVCESGGWDLGTFWRLDSADHVLRFGTTWSRPDVTVAGYDALSRQLSLASGVDLPGRVWERGEPVWVPDVVSDADMLRALIASKEGLHTAFCFPIVAEAAVVGVMEFLSHEVRQSDAGLMTMARPIGAQVGRFVQRKQREQELRHQATHDPLTGLPNRVLLGDRLQRALFVARETGKPLALFLMDLDHFKKLNDTHGHTQGDIVLQGLANRLDATLRTEDTVARMSGDEFAVLLPGTTLEGARVVADKLLGAIRQPFVVDGVSVQLGGSIGITVHPGHGSDADGLLKAADAAMYVAKRSGAGVAVYEPQMEERDRPPAPQEKQAADR